MDLIKKNFSAFLILIGLIITSFSYYWTGTSDIRAIENLCKVIFQVAPYSDRQETDMNNINNAKSELKKSKIDKKENPESEVTDEFISLLEARINGLEELFLRNQKEDYSKCVANYNKRRLTNK